MCLALPWDDSKGQAIGLQVFVLGSPLSVSGGIIGYSCTAVTWE